MSQIPRPLALLLGFSVLAVALAVPSFRIAGLLVAFALAFLVVTRLSTAFQLAKTLRPLVKRAVHVDVWGISLPVHPEARLEVESISSFGVGLLIELRTSGSDERGLLKVAQPREATPLEAGLEVSQAAYVSWAGKRLKPVPGPKRPALVIREAR